jgi:hypothetical protein
MGNVDVAAYVAKIVAAKGNAGGGTVFRDGRYVPALRSLKIEQAQRGPIVWLKAEFLVIESAAVDVPPSHRNPGEPEPTPNKAGTDASMIFNITEDTGLNNAKDLAMALANKAKADVDADPTWLANWLTSATSASQPFTGTPLTLTTFRRQIKNGKNAGRMGTFYNMTPYATTPEEIGQLRAMILANKAPAK